MLHTLHHATQHRAHWRYQAPDQLALEELHQRLDLGFEAEDLELLVQWRMPFGRYSGRALLDLPEEYLLWFERSEFPSGELGRLMKLALGIKKFGAEEVVRHSLGVAHPRA